MEDNSGVVVFNGGGRTENDELGIENDELRIQNGLSCPDISRHFIVLTSIIKRSDKSDPGF